MDQHGACTGGARSPGAPDVDFMDWLLAGVDDTGTTAGRGASELEQPSCPDSIPPLDTLASSPATTSRNGHGRPTPQGATTRSWKERATTIRASTNASAAPKSNSWQRRKRELQQLRDQVKKLEDELTERRAYATGSFLPPHSSEEHRQRLQRRQQYLSTVWKLAAEREKQLKSVSLTENARLKQLVERHSQLSRALRGVLFQQQHEHQHQDARRVVLSLAQQARLQSSAERSSLFIALEQKLEARLPLVENAIKHMNASSRRPADMIEMNVNSGESVHPVGNIQRVKAFPYPVASIMDIFCQCVDDGFHGLVLTSSLKTSQLSEDAVGMDCEVEVPRNGESVRFRGKALIKRWMSGGCELLQFGCVTEWLSTSKKGSITEEFSWVVARNASHASALGNCSHMQLSMDSTLIAPSEQHRPSVRSARDLIANTVLPTINVLMARVEQNIENSQLDSMRAAARA